MLAMCVGDAQDAQDDAVRASASGRKFFFCDVPLREIQRVVISYGQIFLRFF